MIHSVKCTEPYFSDVKSGKKNFELRKNDRNYQVGDDIVLNQYVDGKLTGKIVKKTISYMLEGYSGIECGYCILGLADSDGKSEKVVEVEE